MKRQRGRGRKPGGGGGGGNHSNHGNHGNRPFESNGPEVKIRGTAAQIYEKYAQYARDAQSGGDRVRYESYLQHAEHYYRVMAASMPRERLLAQQEAGFGQAQGEGGEGQGNFGQQPQGGNPQGQNEGGEQADPMKVVDAEGGSDDEGDFDGEGSEGGEEGEGGGEEFRADTNSQQNNQGGNDNRGDGRGPRRRRGRRGRPQDGPGGGEGPGPGGGGNGNGGGNGGGGGGSALDSLARRQGALAGS